MNHSHKRRCTGFHAPLRSLVLHRPPAEALRPFFCSDDPYCRVYTPVVMAMPGEKAQALNETTLLRGTLPREPVCTENLTPLIKMLPCRSQVG